MAYTRFAFVTTSVALCYCFCNCLCTQYDEADLPIIRNQDFVMRNLALDNEHRALLTHLTVEVLESVRLKVYS